MGFESSATRSHFSFYRAAREGLPCAHTTMFFSRTLQSPLSGSRHFRTRRNISLPSMTAMRRYGPDSGLRLSRSPAGPPSPIRMAARVAWQTSSSEGPRRERSVEIGVWRRTVSPLAGRFHDRVTPSVMRCQPDPRSGAIKGSK